MLVAITVVLSFISGYLRTPVGKLNISFISVYVCAYLFGPVMGGLTGALADLISVWVSASGAPIPLFTVIEFINGFIFGLFFFKGANSKERSLIKTVIYALLCVLIQYMVNLLRIPVLAGLQNLFGNLILLDVHSPGVDQADNEEHRQNTIQQDLEGIVKILRGNYSDQICAIVS